MTSKAPLAEVSGTRFVEEAFDLPHDAHNELDNGVLLMVEVQRDTIAVWAITIARTW